MTFDPRGLFQFTFPTQAAGGGGGGGEGEVGDQGEGGQEASGAEEGDSDSLVLIIVYSLIATTFF